MKEKLTITITDLDNIKEVLEALDLLFRKITLYYCDKDLGKLNTFILSCSNYFGKVLHLLGYTEKDFGDENDTN